MHQEVKNLNADDIGKGIDYLIPDEKVGALAGGSLEVYYTVTTYAKAFFKSPILRLLVDVDNSTPLEAPVVDKLSADGVLDPADIPLEAIVRVLPYRAMAEGDKVTIHWEGGDTEGTYGTYTVINSGTVNRETVFRIPKRYVDANLNRLVQVWYTVQQGDRIAESEKLAITIREMVALPLPTPTLKEAIGTTLDPADALSGATVVIDATANLQAGDQVITQWQGPNGNDTREKTLTGADAGKTLEVVFAAALVTANAGQTVAISYVVNRVNGLVQVSGTLALQILAAQPELVLDTSPVTLAGKVYLLPGSPDLLPNFPADTTLQRQASGGQAPYQYTSSNPLVAKVDSNGLTSVRGKGTAIITATDALGASKHYTVTVTGVIHCVGLGSGSFSQINKNAGNNGARIPTIHELVDIHALYGNRWPMGNGNYWSSTVSSAGIGGWNWYYVKNMVTGGNFKLKSHNASLGVGIR